MQVNFYANVLEKKCVSPVSINIPLHQIVVVACVKILLSPAVIKVNTGPSKIAFVL